MTLFQTGTSKLHSGGISNFKIDCDALSGEDWRTLARIIADSFRFGKVVGIPTGGLKLAEALKPYISEGSRLTLVVDDILTTGHSMEEMRLDIPGSVWGIVVFARGRCPDWITPIFPMHARYCEEGKGD